MSQHREHPEQKDDLQKELSMYAKEGILLKLNGKISDAQAIAKVCCLEEEGCYMRDYVENEKGEWIELRFDKITDC